MSYFLRPVLAAFLRPVLAAFLRPVLAAALLAPWLAAPAWAARTALDTRAPDLNAPTVRLMPMGQSELQLGLGASFGPNAPLAASYPVTPVPQAVWVQGVSERSDVLVGMFGPGPTALGRYALIPGRLNLEAGVQSYLLPALVVAPIAELQLDVPLGPLTMHLVPAIQPELGARRQLTAFGLLGLEWPFSEMWDLSLSVRGTAMSQGPFEFAPAAGLRCTLSPGLAVEGVGVMQNGAPSALLFSAHRF